MIKLETARLRLREWTRGDLKFLVELLGNEEVMRYYPQRYSRRDAEEWLQRQQQRYQRDGHGGWLVLLKETGEAVGQVGLVQQLVEGEPFKEIGYLIHRDYWRRGYAYEAAEAVREYAFNELGQSSVIALIRPINTPSQGVARKLGMKPVKLVLHGGLEHHVWQIDREKTSKGEQGETCSP